jgi:hypothetical protein
MKVIPETRRVHEIWYLRFYFYLYFWEAIEGNLPR